MPVPGDQRWPGDRRSPPAADTVTVTGTFEQVVVDTVDGEHIRYLVRGADRTWWLEDLAEPVPTTGSQVTVTGTPKDADTLAVATIQVRVAAAAPAANAAVRGDAGARAAAVLGSPSAGAAHAGHRQGQGDQD